ncbi:hypothetical protein [Kitasatospora sp. NPDC004272]
MRSWDESGGTVSSTFDEWDTANKEIRAFLELSTRWSKLGDDEAWQASGRDVDAYEHSVHLLYRPEYLGILHTSVLKDGVTAFEVYMEKAVEEVLHRRRKELTPLRVKRQEKHESPLWWRVVQLHADLGNKVEPESVTEIRKLRHLLTHQRGQLRTVKQLEAHRDAVAEAAMEDWQRPELGDPVHLSREKVLAALGTLEETVRNADRRIWEYGWGECKLPLNFNATNPNLQAIPEAEVDAWAGTVYGRYN